MTRRDFQMAVGGACAAASLDAAPARTYVDGLEFFDCDVILGAPLETAEDVLRELDHYHVREALLFHSSCKLKGDAAGNALVLNAVKRGRGRLHGCWSIVPAGGVLPTANATVDALRQNGLRVVRAFPTNHGYRLEELRETLAALEQHRVPLIADYGITNPHQDRTNWDSVEWALRQFPRLEVIVAHPPSRKNPVLFRLFELSRRFHLSPSGFRIHQEALAITELFGPQALVYGSHLPYYTAAAPIAEVIYSEMREEDQRAMAGGNLRALLREVKL